MTTHSKRRHASLAYGPGAIFDWLPTAEPFDIDPGYVPVEEWTVSEALNVARLLGLEDPEKARQAMTIVTLATKIARDSGITLNEALLRINQAAEDARMLSWRQAAFLIIGAKLNAIWRYLVALRHLDPI